MLITLIPLGRQHEKEVQEGLNDAEVLQYFPVSYPYTKNHAKAYIKREQKGFLRGLRYAFAIYEQEEFVGVCALSHVCVLSKQAEVYYWVKRACWGRGIASSALEKLMLFAKNTLCLKRLKTGVLVDNNASFKVLKRNGFDVDEIIINKGEFHTKFLEKSILKMCCALEEES